MQIIGVLIVMSDSIRMKPQRGNARVPPDMYPELALDGEAGTIIGSPLVMAAAALATHASAMPHTLRT
jgi:hypothetical protein